MNRIHRVLSIPALSVALFAMGCGPGGDEGFGHEEANALAESAPVAENTSDLLGGSSSPCPTAPEGELLYVLWRTLRAPQRFVWSSDGKQLLGWESISEARKSLDPLNGSGVDRRKQCHQLFLVSPDGTGRRNLGGVVPGLIGDMYAFPSAGYVLVSRLQSTLTVERVAMNGTRRTVADLAGTCVSGKVIPSPDGSIMAYERTTMDTCGDSPYPTSQSTTVSFLNADGSRVGGEAALTLPAYSDSLTWTPQGRLILSVYQKDAYEVARDGSVSSAPVPGCFDPPTTSSQVDSQGRIIDVVDGKPAITGTDMSRVFGCQ